MVASGSRALEDSPCAIAAAFHAWERAFNSFEESECDLLTSFGKPLNLLCLTEVPSRELAGLLLASRPAVLSFVHSVFSSAIIMAMLDAGIVRALLKAGFTVGFGAAAW